MIKLNAFVKIAIIVFVFIWLLTITITAVTPAISANANIITEDIITESVLLDEPKLYPEIEYKIFYEVLATEDYLVVVDSAITEITSDIAGGKYTINACNLLEQELSRLTFIKEAMVSDIDHYTAWEDKYYYATKTWLFLKQAGYSDVVASAIIGNMMIETGGRTLYLDPTLYDKATGTYYGLCQWSLKYRPEVRNMSFDQPKHLAILYIFLS